MKITLIDADSLCYIGKEGDDEQEVLDKVDNAISNIIVQSGATHYMVCIEPFGNNVFRGKIVSQYKANRKDKPKPPFYKIVKQYIIDQWLGYGLNGYETDDVIVSLWRKIADEYPFDECVLAVMDKDYKQYPITMFDTYYRRFGEVTAIAESEARYNLFFQMISGDSVDNIKGIKSKGKKTAEMTLAFTNNIFIATCRLYREVYGSRWQKEFIKNYTQVRLLDNLRVDLRLNEVQREEDEQ
jgi:5'-3' exonuclease